eukprot:1725550-Pyramimonas_sp.AAC.1
MSLYTSVQNYCKQTLTDFKKAMKLMEREDEQRKHAIEEQERKEKMERQSADAQAAAAAERFLISARAFHG